jgi:hypothetical protein
MTSSDEKRDSADVRVIDPGVLARTLAVVAFGLGVFAVAAFALMGKTGLGIYLALLCLGAAFGSALFRGMRIVADEVGERLDGEPVVAYGVGGGGKGLLGAHAMVVTAAGVRTVAANPWGPGPPSAVMPFAEIKKLNRDKYSLSVSGEEKEIALKRCSPFQVLALAEAIGGRIEPTVDARTSCPTHGRCERG